MSMRRFINEASEDFEFTSQIMKMLGISKDQVSDLIEKLDVDDLTDLVDACVKGNAEEARKIVGGEMESLSKEDEPKISDHEQMAQRLFSPKDKAKANSNARKMRKLNKELGEDTDSAVVFNIGDTVLVDTKSKDGDIDESHDAEEGTVKIPRAPGDTVGVMINGELKMVDKKKVHKLDEAVLGMTQLPGLKPTEDIRRMRELAGIRDEDAAPEFSPTPTPSMGEPVANDMDSLPAPGMDHEPEVPELDLTDHSDMDDMGDDDMGAPIGAPPMASPMDAMNPGSALEDAAALDQAISEIENMIPNVKISEYKTLVARLKALVSMAESAGKAALTEGRTLDHVAKRQNNQVPPRRMTDKTPQSSDLAPYRKQDREMEEGQLPFAIAAEYKSKKKPVAFDGEQAQAAKPTDLKSRMAAFVTNRRGKTEEDRITPKAIKKPAPEKKDGAEDASRKTLMDYVREADGDMETIGMDRNTALRAFQSRMGPGTSPQDANKAFDAMFASGHVKQQNGAFKMPAMSDEQFHTTMAQTGETGEATNGSSQNTPPADTADNTTTTGSNTTNPGANVQGASNPAYQGR